MVKISRYIVIVVVLTALLLIPGCGYKVGNFMHPQVKTIGFATLKNETMEPLVTQLMRKQLNEQFMVDGSLKVKNVKTADCILYGRILDVKTTETAEDSFDSREMIYRAAQWALEVKFEFVVMIPGRKKPLISKRIVVGSSRYDVTNDHNIARRTGLQQASMRAAKQVVLYTTEAW